MLLFLVALAAPAAETPPPDAVVVHARRDGIGVEVADRGEVTAVLVDGPAWTAGLRPGDTLTTVDGQGTRWMAAPVLAWHLGGAPGSPVRLRVEGEDGAVEVERAAIDPWNGTWALPGDATEDRAAWCVEGDCEDGRGKARTSFGVRYAGGFEDGHLDGSAAVALGDGRILSGRYEAGVLEGPATLRIEGGGRVEGWWDAGIQYGTMVRYQGEDVVYDGEAIGLVPHGQGTLEQGELRYEGTFRSGRYHGEGKLTLPDGDVHEGSFVHGLAHGPGTYRLAEGGMLQGGFVKGQLQGPGKRTWPDGRAYEGTLKDGRPHGEGSLRRTDGTVHEGTFVEGTARGYGVRTYPSGRRLEGLFVDLHRAVGRLYDAEGTLIHEGWTRVGRAEGWGRQVEPDGTRSRERWWFNDGPHRQSRHPRDRKLGDEEKETFENIDWDAEGRAAFE
jgi:hypothetical protein